MDRKVFMEKFSMSLLSYALLDSLFCSEAIGKAIQPITDHWAKTLNEYCQDLNLSKISPLRWQEKVEALFRKIELHELLQFIDFDRLSKGFDFPDLGVNTKMVHFPKLAGLPEKTVFVKKIFGLNRDRAIIPHGHSNMSSAHLVLKGAFHLRHYEKLAEEERHLHIKPTIDKLAIPGDVSSISDEKNNVHWFISRDDGAFTFDVIMLDLAGQQYDIHNLDMDKAEWLGDGTLRAPKMEVNAALKKYGKMR